MNTPFCRAHGTVRLLAVKPVVWISRLATFA